MISKERIEVLLDDPEYAAVGFIRAEEISDLCQLALEALRNRNSGAKAVDIGECIGIEPDAFADTFYKFIRKPD